MLAITLGAATVIHLLTVPPVLEKRYLDILLLAHLALNMALRHFHDQYFQGSGNLRGPNLHQTVASVAQSVGIYRTITTRDAVKLSVTCHELCGPADIAIGSRAWKVYPIAASIFGTVILSLLAMCPNAVICSFHAPLDLNADYNLPRAGLAQWHTTVRAYCFRS